MKCDCHGEGGGDALKDLLSRISAQELTAGIKALQLGIAALEEREDDALDACGPSLALLDELLRRKLSQEGADHHSHGASCSH